ncbi:MAG: hypothetical protein KME09_04645 [Pleurocapsa minor HA4230-MV1]|jgi:hypothetical protein|nr:hypothetical protein [Pleurocapsa minor HA4230-MV1]
MGEAKRRKAKDPNYGQVKQKVVKGSFSNSYNSFREYIEDSTKQKGRGYVACCSLKCFYYGQQDFLGDEEDFLLKAVRNYDPGKEAIVVRQFSPNSPLFTTEVCPLDELNRSTKQQL